MQIEKPLTEQNCDGSIDKFHSILVAQNFDGLVHAKVVHELIDYHLKAIGSVELGHRLSVTPRPGGPTRGNRRVTLNRSQFPETHSRPRKAHEISQPDSKTKIPTPEIKYGKPLK